MPKETTEFIDCEYYLFALDRARLIHERRIYAGKTRLDVEALRACQLDCAAYGRELWKALFPDGDKAALLCGYRECLATARARGAKLRFRLHLAPDLPAPIRELEWECLYDPEENVHLAAWPIVAFSRYVPGETRPVVSGRPRLLVAIAAPLDARRLGLPELDRPRMEGELREVLQPLARQGRLAYEFFTGPVTAEALLERLVAGKFHLLHLIAHAGVGKVVLQDGNGLAHSLEEQAVSRLFLGPTALRLVALMACHGADPSRDDPWSGLGGRLVQRDLPVVIAMRRRVSIAAALLFSRVFYPALCARGRVDTAVTEARFGLSVKYPAGSDWSHPVLYMRLADGRLWKRRRRWPFWPFRPGWTWAVVLILLVSLLVVFSARNDAPIFERPPIPPPRLVTPTNVPSTDVPPTSVPEALSPSETFLPGEISSQLARRIREAGNYLKVGSPETIRIGLAIYRDVVDELPREQYDFIMNDADLERLLRKANESFAVGAERAAADFYRVLFEDLEEKNQPKENMR